MNNEILLNLIKKIKPHNAKKYLSAKGWKEVKDSPRKDTYLFAHPAYKYKQIIIPQEDDYELYASDMFIAVQRLQEIEKREITSIITQLTNPDIDILRYRIQSQKAEAGSLSLNVVNKFINSVIDSLRAAVCDNLYPQTTHHSEMSNKSISQILEHAQFGQTEHGSFVVKVFAPLDIGDEYKTIRKGIVHLFKSTKTLVDAIEANSIPSFINQIQKKTLFSDNLVSALIDMQIWDDAAVELSTEWSPILPEKNIPSKIMIPAEYFRDIEKINQVITLSPKILTNEDHTVNKHKHKHILTDQVSEAQLLTLELR
ncbi:MAG: hypothetical protein LBQ66_05430 [Planctomycetaceae bacterium]|jgi:hypothetical protein|nr:hypothetical protein [Planctomycetaceae bacterium]